MLVADVHSILAIYGLLDPAEALGTAENAAERAMAEQEAADQREVAERASRRPSGAAPDSTLPLGKIEETIDVEVEEDLPSFEVPLVAARDFPG